MSSVPNTILPNLKGFETLAKNFDVVELNQSNEKFNILTCKDRVKKQDCIIEYEVWLSLKIRKSFENMPVSFSHSNTELIEGCIEKILQWIPCLKEVKKPQQQLSLFGDENEVILEEEPPSPVNGSDSNWNGYFRKSDGVKRRNLMKLYSFMELFDFQGYWTYRDINYNALAPSKEELIEIIKNGIIKYKNNHGRYEDVWNDDDSGYINKNGPLSDYELFSRVFQCHRFFIMPYKSYEKLFYDNSYKVSECDEDVSHRFYFDYGKLNGDSFSSRATMSFDLFSDDLINWLRETFNVEKAEYKTDKDILEHSLQNYLEHFDINIDELKFKNFNEFKSFFEMKITYSDKNSDSTCNYTIIDGYRFEMKKDNKKSTISISQVNKFRKVMNYPIPEEFEDQYKTPVIELNYKDILKSVFELFNRLPYKQETLF